MHTLVRGVAIIAFANCLLVPIAFSDSPRKSESRRADGEVAVFVTGSLIPQRVKIRSVASDTTSPLRVIDRREIDQTGRQTTPGALVNEPSLRIIGH